MKKRMFFCMGLFLFSVTLWAEKSTFRVIVQNPGQLSSVLLTKQEGPLQVRIYLLPDTSFSFFELKLWNGTIRLLKNGRFRLSRFLGNTPFSLKYDNLGRLSSIGKSVLTYDNLGRIESVHGVKISYDAFGVVKQLGSLQIRLQHSAFLEEWGDLQLKRNSFGQLHQIGEVAITFHLLQQIKTMGNIQFLYDKDHSAFLGFKGKDERFEMHYYWNLPKRCKHQIAACF